jgi:hypothetical protein
MASISFTGTLPTENSFYAIDLTASTFNFRGRIVQELVGISFSNFLQYMETVVSIPTSYFGATLPSNFSVAPNNTVGSWTATAIVSTGGTGCAYSGNASVSASVLSNSISILLTNSYSTKPPTGIRSIVVNVSGLWISVGSWTPLTNAPPGPVAQEMMVLTDGTVMCHGDNWVLLTPDAHGSYINGTWSALPQPSVTVRSFGGSTVMPSGKLYLGGGEYYSTVGPPYAEIFDPLTQTWTVGPNQPFGWNILDGQSILLSNGQVFQDSVYTSGPVGPGFNNGTLLYDPPTNTYIIGAYKLQNASSDEVSLLLLPAGSILDPSIYPVGDPRYLQSQRYIPSQQQWIFDSTGAVFLGDAFVGECGTAYMLPNGQAIFFGSSPVSEYYTPSGNTARGVWATGPAIIANQGQPDPPGCMMTNGKILLRLCPTPNASVGFAPVTNFYEFDYTTNTFYPTTAPAPVFATIPTQVSTMTQLPNGQVLLTRGQTDLYTYTPSPLYQPLAIPKPVVGGISVPVGGVYTITGAMFNGISQGSYFGDDIQSFTNYPIIRLVSGSNMRYCRTTNWNSAGIQQYGLLSSCNFTLPAGLSSGNYSLHVTANGIASDPYPFVV